MASVSCIYPVKHYVMPQEKIDEGIASIREELSKQLIKLRKEGKTLEAARLESRTLYDIEMLQETGFCAGIENYAYHFSDREPGERPFCLLDYFPKPYLTIVDKSHISVPQLKGRKNIIKNII